MRRIAQLTTSLAAAAGILLALGFGATQALAGTGGGPSGPASARTCNINFCEDFCGAGSGTCHYLTGECICG